MSGFSGYQFGFQAGFQVIYSNAPVYNGNGLKNYEYHPTSHELRHIERLNQLQQLKVKERVAKEDFAAKQIQIEQLELKRLREGLADQRLQEELFLLMLQQQQILLAQLELERLILELIEEEEGILIILLTTPL